MAQGKLVLACIAALALAPCAPRAQMMSARDGYGPDGAPRVHVELTPYLWLAGLSASANFGRDRQASFDTGVPSIGKVLSVLNGAFMGEAWARYGAFSVMVDGQYVNASGDKSFTGAFGVPRGVHAKATLNRIAPGFGWQPYNGAVGGVPTTVDILVGAVFLRQSASLNVEQSATSHAGISGSTAQPWATLRLAIYPWPRWRFAVSAGPQGFGVDDGNWGWNASATATYAITRNVVATLGFRALNTSISQKGLLDRASASLTAYGPLFGVGLTF